VTELERVYRVKQRSAPASNALGPELVSFFKRSVEKRCQKLSKIAGYWEKLVPALLLEHCALESFSRGSLTVIVDSAPHLYDLKQLLLAGLEQQLVFACKSAGLRKITLKPGRWYAGSDRADAKVQFS
jgi:hypothetical protein